MKDKNNRRSVYLLRAAAVIVIAFTLLFSSAFGTYAATKTRFAKNVFTTLHTKKDSKSSSIQVWYDTRLKIIASYKSKSGCWFKVRIGDKKKNYYVWQGKGESKFRKTSARKADYTAGGNSDYQNEILHEALRILKNWNTRYDFDKIGSKGEPNNGIYYFDCSGYATYVINKVMQKYDEEYYLPWSSTKLYELEDASEDIKVRTVCSGKLDTNRMKPGDLVFFNMSSGSSRPVDHVAIYMGKGRIIQSTKTIKGTYTEKGKNKYGGVCIAPLTGVYKRTFKCAKRVIPE